MDNKLVPLDGKGENNELKNLVREAQKELPVLLQVIELQTKKIRHRYLCLLEEGFTHRQALELCKAWIREE